MHLSLDLVGPNGERVVHGCKCQPRFRNRDCSGLIFRVVDFFGNLKKDQCPFSAMFHGIPRQPHPKP